MCPQPASGAAVLQRNRPPCTPDRRRTIGTRLQGADVARKLDVGDFFGSVETHRSALLLGRVD
ncbi:hypothetical protein A2J03_19580 [Rhodococcus sp. EPR-157]|nr:hypothetical protein A2J03_19580 [Rhodococcus sp. EPR-157]